LRLDAPAARLHLLLGHANRQNALTQIESSLRAGAQIFEKLIEQRNQQITNAAAIVSRDHAFQEAFAGADQDRPTTLSALESLQGRVKADVVLIASLEKELLFDTHQPDLHGVPFPFPKLIDKAETTESAYAFVPLGNELYAMAVTPLLAPIQSRGSAPDSASTMISRGRSKHTLIWRSRF
jgi:hypothetical protein